MKKLLCIALVLAVSLFASGFGEPPAKEKASYPHLIDNFEDGTFAEEPEWFVFDNITPVIVKNSKLQDGDAAVVKNIGEYSLKLSGSTTGWYVGGLGSVLGIDASKYDTVEIDVYGNGENTGRVKIELYDDDNNNAEIEVDKDWKPVYDDLFVTEIAIDWSGWKHLSIPISDFAVEGGGNKKFDPDLVDGSSGLNKIQIICLTTEETGDFDCNIDNIELGVK